MSRPADIRVTISQGQHFEMRGTAAALALEGVIPPGFVWPVGHAVASWTRGRLSFSLGRVRLNSDAWVLRAELARVERVKSRAETLQGLTLLAQTTKARCDARFVAFLGRLHPGAAAGALAWRADLAAQALREYRKGGQA